MKKDILNFFLLKEILKIKDVELILFNGLSQKNDEKNKLCLYEQKKHEDFLDCLNIKFIKIEKLMTNDAYIFFNNKKNLLKSKRKLDSTKFKNKKIFYTEIVDKKNLYDQKVRKILNLLKKRNFVFIEKTNIWSVSFFSNLKGGDYLFVNNRYIK